MDDVIDPADTRFWIVRGLESCPPSDTWQVRGRALSWVHWFRLAYCVAAQTREHKKRYVDTW